MARTRRLHDPPTLCPYGDDSGLSLVEICVATMLLSIVLIGVVASMGSGLSLVGQARQRSAATGVAQQEIEAAHNMPYTSVALSTMPVHSIDSSNPDYNVTGASYGGQTLDIDTNGLIAHNTDVTVGTTAFSVYRFVTWVDDSTIGSTLCPNGTETFCDYKQVVVMVVWKNPVRSGSINSTSQTTFVSDGRITVPQTTAAPGAGATHLAIAIAPLVTVGQTTQVSATAVDSTNITTPTYRGTIHFTSSDTHATLPADYTFVTTDAGTHAFSVILNTLGPQTLTATDTSSSSTNGTAPTTVAASSPCSGDTTPPTGGSVLLSSVTGAYTSLATVSIALNATDGCTGSPITVDLSYDNRTWSVNKTQFSSGSGGNASFTLPADGPYVIYARFRDGMGNSSVTASSSFALDTSLPSTPANLTKLSVSCQGSVRTVKLTWSTSTDVDGAANIAGYRMYKYATSGTKTTLSLVTPTSAALQATDPDDAKSESNVKYVVRAVDQAGNESADQVVGFVLLNGVCL